MSSKSARNQAQRDDMNGRSGPHNEEKWYTVMPSHIILFRMNSRDQTVTSNSAEIDTHGKLPSDLYQYTAEIRQYNGGHTTCNRSKYIGK